MIVFLWITNVQKLTYRGLFPLKLFNYYPCLHTEKKNEKLYSYLFLLPCNRIQQNFIISTMSKFKIYFLWLVVEKVIRFTFLVFNL